jgi:hypothetical protein
VFRGVEISSTSREVLKAVKIDEQKDARVAWIVEAFFGNQLFKVIFYRAYALSYYFFAETLNKIKNCLFLCRELCCILEQPELADRPEFKHNEDR